MCLDLAERGRGKTGINPLVGAVLVREGQVIAQGWHEKFGGLHAERMLLEALQNSEHKICSEDTLYCSLEPCAHEGKTPPCTQAIINAGVQNVVYGMQDPNPAVSGKGHALLESAGISVVGPVDSARCRRYLRGFVSLQEQGRPWITIKQARATDGSIAEMDGSPRKITNEDQDAWSHENLRSTHDAILVGVQTLVEDDPQLTARLSKKFDQFTPLRVVLDPNCRIPNQAKVLTDVYAHKTLVIVSPDAECAWLSGSSVHVLRVPVSDQGTFLWRDLWGQLTTPQGMFCGITSILVEGGQRTWDGFLAASQVDECVFLTERQ